MIRVKNSQKSKDLVDFFRCILVSAGNDQELHEVPQVSCPVAQGNLNKILN